MVKDKMRSKRGPRRERVNSNGGFYQRGKSYGMEMKLFVAARYLDHKESPQLLILGLLFIYLFVRHFFSSLVKYDTLSFSFFFNIN